MLSRVLPEQEMTRAADFIGDIKPTVHIEPQLSSRGTPSAPVHWRLQLPRSLQVRLPQGELLLLLPWRLGECARGCLCSGALDKHSCSA
ncbi:unnamed protein product [Rangifer tarandus platyrhynchus]|uniref:Uncharacterized protein n=1 Tax=Rangifer tarandus platyrhynchus TaxID=3082113 RepID=A0AC59ZWV2_RANTA